MELKIEYLSPDELRAYEKNAKLHPDEQIVQIMKSIEEFGMNDPIAIWKDNVVIEGHGRLKACLELGIEKVPVIRLDNLTDEQRRAYTLVHNKLTMNSGFDFDILSAELDNILDIDMEGFGFFNQIDVNMEELNGLFEDAEPKEKEPKQIQCPHCKEWFTQE